MYIDRLESLLFTIVLRTLNVDNNTNNNVDDDVDRLSASIEMMYGN